MKYNFIVLCIFSAFLIGCSSTKIWRGNEIYWLERDGAHSDILHRYRVCKPFKAEVSEQKDFLQFDDLEIKALEKGKNIEEIKTKVEIDGNKEADKREVKYYKYYKEDLTPKRFRYGTRQLGLQALTIPIKIKPAIYNNGIVKYPSQAEAGFNIGFAGGMKYCLNNYTSKKNLWNKNNVAYSFTPGAFMSLGTTALDPATNAPNLSVARTSATFSYGGFLLLGINNINIGYAFGFDDVLGEGKDYWIYQNHLWHGIIISLDIIKF